MYKKLRNFGTVPRASQIWCQNVLETRKKIGVKRRGESFARCGVLVITQNVGGGGGASCPPSLIRVDNSKHEFGHGWKIYQLIMGRKSHRHRCMQACQLLLFKRSYSFFWKFLTYIISCRERKLLFWSRYYVQSSMGNMLWLLFLKWITPILYVYRLVGLVYGPWGWGGGGSSSP